MGPVSREPHTHTHTHKYYMRTTASSINSTSYDSRLYNSSRGSGGAEWTLVWPTKGG